MYVIQRALATGPLVALAGVLSRIGEHALGWLLLGGVGVLASKGKRRREWMRATRSVFVAHAAAVVLKRIVRRPRPDDPRIRVLVGTPSAMSFPSAHVTSTTAAVVAFRPLLAVDPAAAVAVATTMAVSRMVLGVHFLSDVVAAAGLGWVVARGIARPGVRP